MSYQLYNILFPSQIFTGNNVSTPNFHSFWQNWNSPQIFSWPQNLNNMGQWERNSYFPNPNPQINQNRQVQSFDRTQNENQGINKRKSGRKHINSQTEISSAKRNAQQNMINQFFSYYNDYNVSIKYIEKILKKMKISEQNIGKTSQLIYLFIRILNNRRKRKYMSRKYLLKLFFPIDILQLLPQIQQKLKTVDGVNIEMISQFFRRLVQSFFKATYQSGVMTSRRITYLSREHHLNKLRKLNNLVGEVNLSDLKQLTQKE